MNARWPRARFAALALAVASCKPAVDVANPSPFEEEEESIADPVADDVSHAEPPPSAVPAARRRTGAVQRAALDEVLASGPGAFLAGVDVQPSFHNRRFAGWEILRFWSGDARFAELDLLPGDVITSVNDRPLARPEELFAVWDALRDATELVVRGVRGGDALELRFEIAGDATPAEP